MLTRYVGISAIAVLVGILYVPPGLASRPANPGNSQSVGQFEKRAFADFEQRAGAYAQLHREVARRTVPPLEVTTDPARIWQAVEALAMELVRVRQSARAGDIFTPEIATAFRHVIATGCIANELELLARTHDEEDLAGFPFPAPAVHGRWPEDLPLTTMPPDILAVLPALPAELEYRFMNRDLVLWDVDANLIVDFVTAAIAVTTTP
jgi:hypothetical protein